MIHLMYGTDGLTMAYALCESFRLKELIGDRERKIMLKPNLVNSTTADYGATTHSEITEGVIRYLKENGFHRIVIAEGSWIGGNTTEAFSVCGYLRFEKEYGVALIDTKRERAVKRQSGELELSLVECYSPDVFLINLPVLKAHCQTKVTCALKNMKGLITDGEKRCFHALGLHKPIALLNQVIRQDFIIVDGICGDLTFEEGGNPVPMNIAYAAADPVLCDSYACELLGVRVQEVGYIIEADRLGLGSMKIDDIKYLNKGSAGKFRLSGEAGRLAALIHEDSACSACYGSLIHALSKMKKKPAFKICIGQGYRGVEGEVGVGSCTLSCKQSLKGCPPTANEIKEFLNRLL